MAKTILITGASSGIGRTTAKCFQEKGWNVVATMRNPDKEEELNKALDQAMGSSYANKSDEYQKLAQYLISGN